jgi:hypothetical protein
MALVQRQTSVAFVEADLSGSSVGGVVDEGGLLEEDMREWLPNADSVVDAVRPPPFVTSLVYHH